MAYIVRVPGLGMQQDRAKLVAWHVDPGDDVTEGQVIAEVETEKSVFEVESKEDGVLRRTYAGVGDVRKPNEPLGIVAAPDETIGDLESKVDAASVDAANVDAGERREDAGGTEGGDSAAGSTRSEAEASASASSDGGSSPASRKVSPRARKRAEELGVDVDDVDGTRDDGVVTADDVERAADGSDAAGSGEEPERVTPRARRRADELGVDLTVVEGTGPGGAVTEDDVEAAASEEEAAGDEGEETGSDGATTADRSLTLREERPFSEIRRTIARRLQESDRRAVHVTLDRAAEAEAAKAAAAAAERELGTDVSLMDVLLVALSATLTDHPEFNGTVEDETHRLYEEHNVGVAVDYERGLITPVLKGVDGMSIEDVATERRETTERALAGEFAADELEGGTFTVTNLGPYGVESFDPVINPPQVAILGVNAVEERLSSVGDGGGTREVREYLPLSLSFDHRAVDGADAARFLESLVGHLEDPWPLLPEGVEAPSRGQKLPERSVSARTEGGVSGVVTGGSFEWSFDEPADLGGTGAAPTPVDHFVGSVAACLAASVGYQADSRDVDLDDVRVDATGRPERGSLESIELAVTMVTDADADSIERLVELGKRGCYVTQVLRDDLSIEVTWERG